MAKEQDKEKKVDKRRIIRAEKYEEKVKFDGTLEDMIKMAGKTTLGDKKDNK